MAEVAKRKSTLDKQALRKITNRLEEGYSRQAIFEEMKQEYSDHTTLSDLIATTPDREQVGRYQGLLNSFKALVATLLVFKIGLSAIVIASNLPLTSLTDIAPLWPFGLLVLLSLGYGYILLQSPKLTNGTKPFWLGLGLITGFNGGLLLLLEIFVISLVPLQIAEATSISLLGVCVFHVVNLGIAIAAFMVAVKLKRRLFPHLQQLSDRDYPNPGKIFWENQNIADDPEGFSIMVEAVKLKSTIDKEAYKKIANRLEEGYSRQAIYAEMKPEYSDLTRLANRIAAIPDREQVGRYQRLLNLFKALVATLLVFKIGLGVMGIAANLMSTALTDIAQLWEFGWLILPSLGYGYILLQSPKLTNGTKPFCLGLGLITGFNSVVLVSWEIAAPLQIFVQISEAISVTVPGMLSFLLVNLGIVIAAIVVAVKLKRRLFPHLQQLAFWDYSNPGEIFWKDQNIADNTKASSGAS